MIISSLSDLAFDCHASEFSIAGMECQCKAVGFIGKEEADNRLEQRQVESVFDDGNAGLHWANHCFLSNAARIQVVPEFIKRSGEAASCSQFVALGPVS